MMGAAEAGFAAMTLMQGIQFAGAAMSLVGNLTGNSDLMKIGALAGLAGAAGGAGFFGEDIKNLGAASGGAGATPSPDAALSQTPTNTADVLGAPTGTELPVGQQASGAMTSAIPDSSSSILDPSKYAGGMPSELTAPGATGINSVTGLPAGVGEVGPVDYSLPGQAPAGPGGPGIKPPTMGPGTQMTTGSDKGLIGRVMGFTKENPTGAMMIGKGIEGAVDMATGKTQATVNYYKAKAAEAQRAIDLQKERQARLNQGYARVNAGVTVNPNAQVSVPAGLISGARGG
jgi:uncharacterized protein YjbJ (UPF0337 family)